MAATAASDVTDAPVLNLINKRLRALRKKHNRIIQMEEAMAQGKPINKEQEEVLKAKPSVCASIDELEKLRQPLAAAVAEEISLALQRQQVSASPSLEEAKDDEKSSEQNLAEFEPETERRRDMVEDLLNLLYFGSMFDVKSQNDFTSTMLTRTHERGCCLTYDYVTDDATDLLDERDLDLIAMLGGLLISRPVDSSLSHKNALQQCLEHANQWLANSDQPVGSDPSVTYAGLRAKLNKIMASDYFTTTPEMKATVEMAAAAAGNYASFPVPLHGSTVPVGVPVQIEGSDEQYQRKEDETANFQGNESYGDQSCPLEETQKDDFEYENPADVPPHTELDEPKAEGQNERNMESKEHHYVPKRGYQNQRGSRGGGRRGYSNGRGGRGSSRGGGPYQNGRNHYYDQPGSYYQRSYYSSRGRGGRGGGGGGGGGLNFYNNHGSRAEASHATADS